VIAKVLNDLQVYKRARSGSTAVFALMKRTELGKDFDLSRQLADAANSVCANISATYDELGKMLTRFIQYLRRCDRRQRG
jgi:four helix bundle protein